MEGSELTESTLLFRSPEARQSVADRLLTSPAEREET